MKYIKNLKTIVLLLSTCFAFAQELPQVVPLSPEASSIFRFNETPVSLYNGTHNTNIPLLEINSGGVSIPISLSYSSRGVQVTEVASRVGMGWTLNYGGMISRQVRGRADEHHYPGTLTSNLMSGFYENYNARGSVFNYGESQGAQYDFIPDKYMLNSNFYSGEFYMDKNNPQILTQKISDIKITGNTGSGFQVIDNAGNKYTYGENYKEYDRTLSSVRVYMGVGAEYPSPINEGDIYNSWNLETITTATNHQIQYIYAPEDVGLFRRSGDYEYIFSGDYQAGSPEVSCNYNQCRSHQNLISEIRFNEGKVKFINQLNTRDDLSFGHALDRIELYNVKNELIKKIKFNYVYKIGFEDDNINYHLRSADNMATKRLFLTSVVFIDLITNEEQTYSFEYDEQQLPSRHSNSIDSWGYYNGKNRGQYLRFIDNGGNSAVDPVKMQAGILKKITYPTGGSTVFEYEPNFLKNNLPEAIKIQDPNPTFSKSIVLSIFEPQTYDGGRYIKTFTINNLVINSPTINVNLSVPKNFPCRLINHTTNTVTNLSTGNNPINGLTNGSYSLVVDPRDSNWNPYPDPNNPTNLMENSFFVSLNFKEREYNHSSLLFGPGNRIKKITNYSATGAEENSKKYEYVDSNGITTGYLLSVAAFMTHHPNSPDGNGYDHTPNLPGGLYSSFMKDNFGYAMVNEYVTDKFNNKKDKVTTYYSLIPDVGNYFRFPVHPVSDNEWLRGKELLQKVYKKTNGNYSLVKMVENDYLLFDQYHLGLYTNTLTNINDIYINYHNNIEYTNPFQILDIEKKLNENISYSNVYQRNRTKFAYPYATFCPFYENGQDYYGYRTSFFIGGTLDLASTKVTDYFENEVVETTTTYDYDYNEHYNLAKTATTNSLEETLETKYYYPLDSEMSGKTLRDSLINKNMVGMPLVVQSFNGTEKTSEVETVYKNWNDNLLAPEIIKTSNGALALEDRVKYNLVEDANGNPLEVQQEGGVLISYIWGYNGTLPVAKIENIAYNSIPTNLITDIGTTTHTNPSNSGAPESVVLEKLDALRNHPALANAMVTTYTYKPSVGVSTITDPKGNRITYYYDGFNRLEFVKDKDGNILSENKYHYKN
ncbi:hypothetical protein GOQ30_08400 [Flavobacterium sp. TP390]|uniref:YD repeat-containing protein n=1 Tax=Flavobacterium profundi TaxID=1774945 RepID=A0A6I4IHV8_9FLAO|nr:hypothetical protein [Flavobacterium profundi]MVO09178.1 hypothetical protein [Flavobacterium profundi]